MGYTDNDALEVPSPELVREGVDAPLVPGTFTSRKMPSLRSMLSMNTHTGMVGTYATCTALKSTLRLRL